MDISTAVDIGTLNLFMGKYVIVAKAQFDLANDLSAATVECMLVVDGNVADESAVRLPSPGVSTLPLSAAVNLTSDASAVLNCQGSQVVATRVKLTAVQVETLTFP